MGFFSSFVSFFTGPVADVVLAPVEAISGAVSAIVGAIPGVPEEATSFQALGETIFGGGGAVSPITGRAPIPSPAEGGPPLAARPSGFPDVEELPILQELGIPFLPFPTGGTSFIDPFTQFRQFTPDVEEFDMAVDAPLLGGVGTLPAIFQRSTPVIGGVLGGLAQDIVSGFLRAPQEMGVGQVPARRAPVQMQRQLEKPSTRILRRIFENTGVRIKLSAAKALTRQLGLEAAANCLRVTVMELCTLIITPSPRRRRGISGSDIRIVKRTARRFQSLQEDLSGLVSKRRAAPRRRTKHVHALAHTAPGA